MLGTVSLVTIPALLQQCLSHFLEVIMLRKCVAEALQSRDWLMVAATGTASLLGSDAWAQCSLALHDSFSAQTFLLHNIYYLL